MTDTHALPHFTCVDLSDGHSPDGCLRPASAPPEKVVLCLGNFDGVHVAHAALLSEGMALAKRLSAACGERVACGVLCFFRPSSDAFRPADAPPHNLTTLDEKLSLFAAIGIRYVYLCSFEEVRHLAPRDFLHLLETHLGCVGAVSGYNHRFGAKAAGDARLLIAYFGASAVSVIPERLVDGVTVSSSHIRSLLWAGDAEGAARLLGRPYALASPVTAGKQLGRTIGFPTANQTFPAESLIPAHGVYVARCHTKDGIFPAVANIGSHPTVDTGARVNCESYLIGFTGDLYGHDLKTEFLCFLRPEKRFSDLDELRAAIARDAEAAENYLTAHGLLFP